MPIPEPTFEIIDNLETIEFEDPTPETPQEQTEEVKPEHEFEIIDEPEDNQE